MGWTYGVMGETQITASRATVKLDTGSSFAPCFYFLWATDKVLASSVRTIKKLNTERKRSPGLGLQ